MTVPNLNPSDLIKQLNNKLLINGDLVSSMGGKNFPVYNPASMEIIAHAAEADETDVNNAVEAARLAQQCWRHTDASKRGYLISQCADLIDKHADELAYLMAIETGKALRTECQQEAKLFVNILRFYGGLGLELKGETIPYSDSMLTMTIREPLGVVAAIIAWNVPLQLMGLKIAPAIVAGNTVVVKPAEEAPFTALRAVQLMNTILPKGVLNLISGDGQTTGDKLVRHPNIKKVTFTGSAETGKIICQNVGSKLIPVTMELGGKSPMIVCEDVDLDKAVVGAITGMRFTRVGQSCTAASRIFVHESIFSSFLEKLKEKVNTLKIGDPLDPATDIGTIISQVQYDKIQRYIKIGKVDGTAYECSTLPKDPKFAKGLFIQPIIFTGLSNTHLLCKEEIFGPVTALIPWIDFDDVIQQANDTPFGLGATIWTNDLNRALKGVHALEAGYVQVNQNIGVQPGVSYGGNKQSGLGREGSMEVMLEHFTTRKTVIFNMK